MEVSWHHVYVCLISFAFALVNVVVAQDGSGFISIDCGIREGSDYTDATTGISYTSDAGFIDTGVSSSIQPAYVSDSLDRRLVHLRSFPQGTRNCYNIRPSQGKGNKYLIRAMFMYGNYDLKDQPPNFDVYLGVNYWGYFLFEKSSTLFVAEVLYVLSSDYIEFCLVNTDKGTPFISSLEVRPFNSSLYVPESGTLQLFSRVNFGPATSTQQIRYKDDIYDRIWTPMATTGKMLATNSYISYNAFQIPSIVMSTAMVPQNISQDLQMTWVPMYDGQQFYVYFHFAEVESLQANQSRKFNIYVNGELWNPDASSPIVPSYLRTRSVYSISPLTVAQNYTMKINKTADSTLPPIINAYEIYFVRQFNNLQTDDGDAAAMRSIKKIYGVVKTNWQGDPCRPAKFEWDGVDCSNDDGSSFPRITGLNLSGSGLTGELAPAISNLTAIQTLDLSNNNLSGLIPEFLAQLPSLSTLNLMGNNFTGPIPTLLLQKRDNGSLSLSIGNSTTLVLPPEPAEPPKKKNIVIPVVASVIPALFLLLALSAYLWMKRTKNRQDIDYKVGRHNEIESSLETKNPQLTFSDIKRITNNFQRVVGRGGFGVVYHGCMDETQVAVKMLSPSSIQGYKEFQAEAKILMNVNHKNLTRLVGYCHEGEHLGLIYEFMVNGNLRQHLFAEEEARVLGWQERLQIAIDVAQGLEYLHHGCKPSIIHRDVKSTNILLNEKFEAKLADFGLSRVVPIEGGSHVSTMVAGTPGYIDPEYYVSNRLTEKSDVYSFGVFLMEVITGRPAIGNGQEDTYIVQWLSSMVQTADIGNIADPRLRGNFNVSSVWRAVELAMACINRIPARRPTMTYTVIELKACLEIEIAHHETQPSDSTVLPSPGPESVFLPRAR